MCMHHTDIKTAINPPATWPHTRRKYPKTNTRRTHLLRLSQITGRGRVHVQGHSVRGAAAGGASLRAGRAAAQRRQVLERHAESLAQRERRRASAVLAALPQRFARRRRELSDAGRVHATRALRRAAARRGARLVRVARRRPRVAAGARHGASTRRRLRAAALPARSVRLLGRQRHHQGQLPAALGQLRAL
jgi:hypothetical protein